MSNPASQQRQPRQSNTTPSNNNTSTNAPSNNDANAAAIAASNAMKAASAAGVVRICGTSPAECGYCKGARAISLDQASSSSKAYSLLGDFMTAETYEGYLYRGWRRSGTYLYKPNNWQSCCPALTIRLPVADFQPTKSQRKVVKKMEHLLQPPQSQQQQHQSTSSNSVTKESKKRGNKRKLTNHNLPATTAAADTSSPNSHSAPTTEGSVELGQVLDQMQKLAQPILQALLEKGYQNNNNRLLKTVSPIITFKVKPPQGKELIKNKEESTSTASVTLCTTICAAIAGQSRGAIDRNQLSEQLVQQFKTLLVGKSIGNLPSSWNLTDAFRHAKSGQVFCTLQRNKNEVLANGTSNHNKPIYSSDDASMKDASSVTQPKQPRNSQDKLQQWLDEHGSSMTAFCSTNTTPQLQSPPYPFEVQTIPAHESALDPQVHKLYFLYQNKVHQDADPFTCDLGNKNNLNNNNNNLDNSNSSMTAATTTAVGGDDANAAAGEDDEWSTPATSDGNNVIPQQNMNGKLTPPPPSHSSNPSFVDTAKRMLQREYSQASPERLQQITKSYGSFFQFLVESPFVTSQQNNSSGNGSQKGPEAKVTVPPPSTAGISVTPPAQVQLPAGTYHQQYRVAGMLVAVGVVDVLPQGLSSVYLFYHPQFARDLVPLGKYAILQEIEFSRALRLPYYYLGYYIESCTKMRYKAEYRPSELLCPTTYRWVDAMLAQRIIQTYSPVQHCCTLYYENQEQLLADLNQHQQGEKKKKKEKNGNTHDGHDLDDDDDMSMDDPASFGNHNSSSAPMSPQKITPSMQQPASDHTTGNTRSPTPSRSSTTPNNTSSTTKSILKKPNPTPFPPNPNVERVKMDVGVGVPVTLSMLHERGRETVRPLLEDFVKEAGPELSQKCLVRFN